MSSGVLARSQRLRLSLLWRRMRRAVPRPARVPETSGPFDWIDTIAREFDGTLGISAMDIKSGERVSVNGDFSFPMASTVKIPIAIAVLSAVEKGRLRLGERRTLVPRDAVPGSGLLSARLEQGPITVRLGDALEIML